MKIKRRFLKILILLAVLVVVGYFVFCGVKVWRLNNG